MDMIKLETDVDTQSEEDPIGMHTGEVHVPSPFSVKDEELKVSHVFRYFLLLLVMRAREREKECVCICTYMHFCKGGNQN
jgi:hypothetical protein